MSTAYDVRCKECGDYLGMQDLNHGDGDCRLLIKNRIALEHIAIATENMEDGPEISARIDGSSYKVVNIKFFLTHSGHTLEVIDEYGHVQGWCGKHPLCKCCDRYFQCQMPDGHAGDCDPKFKA